MSESANFQQIDTIKVREFLSDPIAYSDRWKGLIESLCLELDRARDVIRAAKLIDSDVRASAGERLERAFMDYDELVGLA